MNVPNALSLFRIFLVPVFAATFFSDSPDARLRSVFIYAVAFVTDILDGWIARHFHQITRLGRVIDPLADKLMTFAVMVCVCIDGAIPIWAAVIFFCKEAVMALGGVLIVQRTRDVIPSNWLGKASTGVFFAVLTALLLFPDIPHDMATGLITFALVLTLAALMRYIGIYRRIMEDCPNEK